MKTMFMVFGLLGAMTIASCRPAKTPQSAGDVALDEYAKKGLVLYHKYLDGDRNEAKQSLFDWLQLTKSIKANRMGYSTSLDMIYSRLYVLEAKAGDPKTASSYFEQAKRWKIEEAILGNSDPADINDIRKNYTPDDCTELVLSWDRQHHGGKDPHYYQ